MAKEKKKVKETNAGISAEGDIEEIAEVAEKTEKILEENKNINNDEAKSFGEWKPQKNDEEEDIKNKTVEKASIGTKNVEKETNGVKEDLTSASEEVKNATKNVKNGRKAQNHALKASKKLVRPFIAKSIKSLRATEKTLYSKLMLRFNPYFFDTEKVAVDVRHEKEEKYRMDINVTEENTRKILQKDIIDEN